MLVIKEQYIRIFSLLSPPHPTSPYPPWIRNMMSVNRLSAEAPNQREKKRWRLRRLRLFVSFDVEDGKLTAGINIVCQRKTR